MRLDRHVDENLNVYAAAHRSQTSAWRHLSDVGAPAVLRTLMVVAGVILFGYRRLRAALLCVGVALGTLVVVTAVKNLVDRARPVVAHPVAIAPGASFPSGHAFTAAAGALLVVVLLSGEARPRGRTPVRIVAVVLGVLIGFSRLVLGVHFPSDVLAGWFGAAALVFGLLAGVDASSRFGPASADRQQLGGQRAPRPWRIRQRRADG